MSAGSAEGSFFTALECAASCILFAVVFAILVGRLVTADETWLGTLVRGAVLVTLFVIAFHHFGTVWYWVCTGLVIVPMVDELGIPGVAPGLARQRAAQVNAAMSKIFENPHSPIPHVNLAHTLLEAGRFDSGIEELERARSLCDEASRKSGGGHARRSGTGTPANLSRLRRPQPPDRPRLPALLPLPRPRPPPQRPRHLRPPRPVGDEKEVGRPCVESIGKAADNPRSAGTSEGERGHVGGATGSARGPASAAWPRGGAPPSPA